MTATKNKENAVINYIYFCLNYPHDFINQAFKDKAPHAVEHLKNKFLKSYDKHGVNAMNHFLVQLDNENQSILIKWIDENYKAFSHL